MIEPITNERGKSGKWFPLIWAGLAAVILGADYFAGPFIHLAILFVIPVALAAACSRPWWGIAFATLMPAAHLLFSFTEPARGPLADSLANAGIRMVVLVTFSVLIARVTRQAREIRVLHGLLPVCGFCKRIRNEEQNWQPIESFISQRSEASFTHTVCPDCAKQHYGEYYDKIIARQNTDAESPPGQSQPG
ncbi:MAG TPA: hypothetical protein VMU04_17230 [Candidatus Acidoferrum sp.]|nr:hypothetical protein [Candidatus Acidoferrum sp.]